MGKGGLKALSPEKTQQFQVLNVNFIQRNQLQQSTIFYKSEAAPLIFLSVRKYILVKNFFSKVFRQPPK
jgi:hypothetical protein